MDIDLKELREKAQAADGFPTPEAWDEDRRYSDRECAWLDYLKATEPAILLALLDRLERAEARRFESHPIALVHDRSYDGEGWSIALFNGENYSFSDGDSYSRDGDTLEGYTAQFLTHHQFEQLVCPAIAASKKED